MNDPTPNGLRETARQIDGELKLGPPNVEEVEEYFYRSIRRIERHQAQIMRTLARLLEK